MTEIHSFISDSDLDIDLLNNLKNRVIDQKHFYTTETSADLYYQDIKIPRPYFAKSEENLKEEDYLAFLKRNLKNKNEKTAVISLGCGKANFEKKSLKEIYNSGYQFDYIGVDSSRHMLELAEKHLKDCRFTKEFICADFSSYKFLSEIGYLLDEYQRRLFAFFGGTVGNIMSSNISDTLANIMCKGDLLWMNAYIRGGLSKEDDFMIFNRFLEFNNNPIATAFNFYPLKHIGVPFKNGKMTLAMEEEKSIGALRFIFSFEFTTKTVIKFRDEVITILPEEKIELFNMRAYDKKTFEKFFIEHGFKLVDSQSKGNSGQFLFKKK